MRRLAGGTGLLVVALAATVWGLSTEPGHNVVDEGLRWGLQGLLAPGWTLDRPRLRLAYGGHLRLDRVALRNPAGERVIAVDHLDAVLDLTGWRERRLRVRRLVADGVDVLLDVDADGVLDLTRAFGGPAPVDPNAPPWGGLPFDLQGDEVDLQDGRFRLRTHHADGSTSEIRLEAIDLAGAVHLPHGAPRVEATGVRVAAHAVRPGPSGIVLAGDVTWTPDALDLPGVTVDLLGAHAVVNGRLLFGDELAVDAVIDATPLHMPSLDTLLGAGLQGALDVHLAAHGPLHSLALEGTIDARAPTRGHVDVRPGTVLCLPLAHAADDACGGPAGPDPELRWQAGLGMRGVNLEDVLPVVRGPLRLEGEVTARGHGTRWPDGVFIDDLRWTGDGLDAYGVPVRSLAGTVTLDHGTLRFSDLALTGVAGTVHGEGSMDIPSGRLDLDLYGPLDLAMLQDLGVPDLSGTGRFTAHLVGDTKADGVPIDVTGEAWLTPFRYGRDVTVDRAHARYRVHVEDAITTVTGTIDGQGAHTYGADSATVTVTDLRVTVDERIHVTGVAHSPRTVYTELVRVEDVHAPFTFDRPRSGGVPVVTAQARVGPSFVRGLTGDRGTADVHLVGTDLDLDLDLRRGDEPFIVAPGMTIDLATLAIRAPTLTFGPSPGQRWLAARPVVLRVVDGNLVDADIALASPMGEVEIEGDLGATGVLDGHLALRRFDLSALPGLAPDLDATLSGIVDATMTLAGPTTRPSVELAVVGAGVLVPGLAQRIDLHGDATVRDDVLTIVDAGASLDGVPIARVAGFIPVVSDLARLSLSDRGDADLQVVVDPGDLDRFNRLQPDLALPAGETSGVCHIVGDLRDPDLDLRAVAAVEVEGLTQRARMELDLQRREGRLEVRFDGYDGLRTTLIGDGDAQTRLSEITHWLLANGPEPTFSDPSLFADDLDVTMQVVELPIETVQAVAGITADVRGALAGTITVTGDPAQPDLATALRVEGRASDIPFWQTLSVTPGEDGYHATTAMGQSETSWLTASGLIPVRVRPADAWTTWGFGDLDVEVAGAGVPLALAKVVDPGIEVDPADPPMLRIAGHVGGPLDHPVPQLVGSLYQARFSYRPLGLAVRDLDLAARLVPSEAPDAGYGAMRVELTRLTGATGPANPSLQAFNVGTPSRFTADGALELRRWLPSEAVGAVTLDHTWLVATDDTQIRASTLSTTVDGRRAPSRLSIAGPWPNLVVRGEVGIDQGFVTLDAADLLESRDMRIDPIIVVHRGASSAREEPPPARRFIDDLDIAVSVDLGRNTRTHITMPVLDDLGALGAQVTRADLEARVGGAVDFGMKRGDITLVGDLAIYDGELRVLRSDFQLSEDSTITFLGRDYQNPRLDVRAQMAVTGGTVDLAVSGTAGQPSLDLSSEDFASEAELFTILLTGQAPEDLTSQQGRVALEAVSDLFLNSVLGGVNLGSVSVEADGTVKIGLPVYRTVYVESAFKPIPRLNENRVTVQAEWSILPKLVLTAAYGDRRLWGTFFWEYRF